MTAVTKMIRDYNHKLDITAGELRKLGLYNLPKDIPDAAYVPRWAVRFEGLNVKHSKSDPCKVHFRVGTCIDAPFRWVEGKCLVENKCELELGTVNKDKDDQR